MSRALRELKLKRLCRLLSEADDTAFLSMIWAANAMQDGRADEAASFLNFPDQAATDRISSEFAIHPWELETLLGLLLTTPKLLRRRRLNCKSFQVLAKLVNLLRSVEDAEYAIFARLGKLNIWTEMHRISQRQFAWQRGFCNAPDLYRYAFIYGNGRSSQYFSEKYGLDLNSFSCVGFYIYCFFMKTPRLNPEVCFREIEMPLDTITKAMKLLASGPLEESRRMATETVKTIERGMRGVLPLAYRPSFLRRYPIIFENSATIFCPLPELIMQRITSGVFYDVVDGQSSLRNEVGQHFEAYSKKLLAAMLSEDSVTGFYSYRFKRNNVDSPDIFLRDDNGAIVAVIECKAKKLTFNAKFAYDPIAEADRDFNEIVKGITQIWRFFSHVRKKHAYDSVSSNPIGIVLTLEPWFFMSTALLDSVFERARDHIASDSDIEQIDQVPVLICSIEDLESTLLYCDAPQFYTIIKSAAEPSFRGWLLSNVQREVLKNTRARKFPFDLREVLPWKARLDELAGKDLNLSDLFRDECGS